MGVVPKHGSRRGIQCNDIIGVLDGIHDAVDHQRRRFGLLRGVRLIDPLQLQVLRIVRGDLCERTVPLAHWRTGVGQPVLWVLTGFEDAVERHIRRGDLNLRALRAAATSATALCRRLLRPAALTLSRGRLARWGRCLTEDGERYCGDHERRE